MEFQFREMTYEDKPILVNFLRSHFGPDSVQCRTNRFEWQFEKYPNNAKIYLCFSNNELIGQICFLPLILRLKNERFSAAFSIDTMISPQYRRKGIGGKFHQIRLEKYQVALSSGQSNANARLYNKMGWLTLGTYFDFRLVKRFPKFKTSKQFVKDLLVFINYKSRLRKHNQQPSVKISEDYPKGMLDLLPRGTDSEAFAEVDQDYLNWRYKDHPYFSYQYIQVFDGDKPLGFCVVRQQRPDQYRVVDFYCRRSAFSALLEGLAYSLNAYSIKANLVGNSFHRHFTETGYTLAEVNQHLVGSSKDEKIHNELQKCDWLIFGGDSDNDR